MYMLMVVFDPKNTTPVYRDWKEGMNFGNVAVKYGTRGDGDHGGSCGKGRKLECWRFGGEHMKRDCPKRAKEK